MEIKDCIKEAYETSKSKGWYDDGGHSVGEAIALMHTELSEALEEYRNGNSIQLVYFKGEKPEGFSVEIADLCIRVFDFCGAHGIDLQSVIELKMEYNKTRPHRHGNKVL